MGSPRCWGSAGGWSRGSRASFPQRRRSWASRRTGSRPPRTPPTPGEEREGERESDFKTAVRFQSASQRMLCKHGVDRFCAANVKMTVKTFRKNTQ